MNDPRTWVEISTSALQHNIETIKQLLIPTQKLGIVVKSNAYGHGLLTMSNLLEKNPHVSWLFTAGLKEAVTLRKNNINKPILVMSYIDDDPTLALKYDIDIAITNTHSMLFLEKISKKIDQSFNVHIKIDTGLSRLGLQPQEANRLINIIKKSSHFNITGIFTHLADNKGENLEYTKYQLGHFEHVLHNFQITSNNILTHVYASAALLQNPALTNFDMVRIGTCAYGLYKSLQQEENFKKNELMLKPILQWKSSIIEIKLFPAGTAISYGCTYKTQRPTSIAVVPVGYWDGYPTSLSGKGFAYIEDQPVPILGIITMNMLMIDITEVKNVKIGSKVTLIGAQREIQASTLSVKAGTVNIELLAGINSQIPRTVVEKTMNKRNRKSLQHIHTS